MAGGQALDMDLDDPNQFQTSEMDNDAYENESYGNEDQQYTPTIPNTTSISKTGVDRTIGENGPSHSNYDQPSIEDEGYAALRDVTAPNQMFGEDAFKE